MHTKEIKEKRVAPKLPSLQLAKILKIRTLGTDPERTLLALFEYTLDNGRIIIERTPKSCLRAMGDPIGYYLTHLINRNRIYQIIKIKSTREQLQNP